jgi:hypothetical protein
MGAARLLMNMEHGMKDVFEIMSGTAAELCFSQMEVIESVGFSPFHTPGTN